LGVLALMVAMVALAGAADAGGAPEAGSNGAANQPNRVEAAGSPTTTIAKHDGSLGDADSKQACTLLTTAEIEAQFGGPVGEATPIYPYCQWLVGDDAAIAVSIYRLPISEAWTSIRCASIPQDSATTAVHRHHASRRLGKGNVTYSTLWQKVGDFTTVETERLSAGASPARGSEPCAVLLRAPDTGRARRTVAAVDGVRHLCARGVGGARHRDRLERHDAVDHDEQQSELPQSEVPTGAAPMATSSAPALTPTNAPATSGSAKLMQTPTAAAPASACGSVAIPCRRTDRRCSRRRHRRDQAAGRVLCGTGLVRNEFWDWPKHKDAVALGTRRSASSWSAPTTTRAST
jgi:hypothetical protein